MPALNCSPVSYGLVWIDALAGLLAEEFFKHGLDLGDTGGTANEDDVVNVGFLQFGILENLFNRLESLLEEVVVQLFELGSGQSLGKVVALVECFDFDLGAHLAGQRALGLFDLTLELAHGLGVLVDVRVEFLVVVLGEEIHDALIEIFTTKMGITGGSLNLEDALVDGQDGHIECTTTEIVDDNLTLLVGLVQSVGESRCGGFVDDTKDVQTGDSTGVFGCGALRIVEVGWDCNDGIDDLFAEIRFCYLLHLAQDHGRDFFWSEGLIFSVMELECGSRSDPRGSSAHELTPEHPLSLVVVHSC